MVLLIAYNSNNWLTRLYTYLSIIFPVYNYLGIQIRGGAFTQDDRCQLEVDLAERFHYEAQVQVSNPNIIVTCRCWNGWGLFLNTFTDDIYRLFILPDHWPISLMCMDAQIKSTRHSNITKSCNQFICQNMVPS